MSFALLLHSHQPVGNFDSVIEETYRKSYRPFLDVLARHPRVRVSLHYSGHLLEWIEPRHPEFFDQLRALVERGQAELVGGGFYEPILPVIPDRDKRAQLIKLRDYLRSRFGAAPRGAWVAERVWEPGLARPLAENGVDYVMLDDTHFLSAGVEAGGLRGYYVTEESGCALRLVPSLKAFRYAIPFREPAETIELLRQGLASSEPVAPLFAMGDDCEKFGGWPETFKHCYENFWLERFFQALEGAAGWVETTTVSDFLDAQPPLGRIYLPTASYEEMMLWALPLEAARALRACVAESSRLPEAERFQRFLRGGYWRNFLAKYPESNQVHKLMLDVSRRLATARGLPASAEREPLLAEAETHLLAAQCNDAYWHGIFGGLYTPHLRTGVQRRLIQAEVLLDRAGAEQGDGRPRVRLVDFDCDGREEALVDHELFGLVLRPADGGTVSSLRFKPADTELINALARRPEPYHAEVREAAHAQAPGDEPPASIHELVRSKEPNLAALLRYDRYPRHVFRSYGFPGAKQYPDFANLALEESAELAGGAWTLAPAAGGLYGEGRASFEMTASGTAGVAGALYGIEASKQVSAQADSGVWRLECRSRFDAVPQRGPEPASPAPPAGPAPLAFGLELVFNLLAPDAPGRYFRAESAGGAQIEPLGFRGELAAPELRLVDEWQGVKIALRAYPEPVWWIAPIETVSQSEIAFERVYQGSAILAVWKPPQTAPEVRFECGLSVHIERWRPA
ncbi:MAG TPA: alpha-amylase/4-alpha-glucanotransferase domain-containing protein [Terriglobia bacterium]|nr:alpha-amylase/4-alpha-glucanotransferase domain-containing protein [Terriglobia bacterium]